MEQAKAFIFDLNGTMIDDMDFHTDTWYRIINDELGEKMSREDVKNEMYGKNAEVLLRIFGPNRFAPEEVERLSLEKEKRYQEAYRPSMALLPGLADFLQRAAELNIQLAIGSAAIAWNIDYVVDGLGIRHYFKALVSADDVEKSKPDPETFVKAAEKLGVEPASCIVFEDNPKGVESALNGGMQCVVLTTMHKREDFEDYPNVLAIIKDYTDPFCEKLLGETANGRRQTANG
jgi:beta-phosphoglucomutase family hydrolase